MTNAGRGGNTSCRIISLDPATLKPRFRIRPPSRLLGAGVPDDAMPGDLVVSNRGAAAYVYQPASQFGRLSPCLTLMYVGNYYGGVRPDPGCKMYDFRGGT